MFSIGDRVYCYLGRPHIQEGEIEGLFQVLTPEGAETWALINWDIGGVTGAMPCSYLSHVQEVADV